MATEKTDRFARFRLSQETIAIVTVGIALAGLILGTIGDLRDEARADRAAWQAESRQFRAEAAADRAEAAADRRAWQATLDAFREEMRSLAQRQAHIEGQVEGASSAAAANPS